MSRLPMRVIVRAILATSALGAVCVACASSSSGGATAHPDSGVSALGLSCSGATPTFSADVQPILSTSCASEHCHGQWGSASALSYLVSYKTTQDTCATAGSIVVPGDIDKSYIFHKLLGVGMCAGTQMMPMNGGKLAAKDIQTIVDWVCQGAPAN